MKSNPAARRFTLLDGMTLVAAPAVSLGVLRVLGPLDQLADFPGAMLAKEAWTSAGLQEIGADLLFLGMPSAVTMTLAVLALRLRRPRPRWRRLARQPGLMACLAALAACVTSLGFTIIRVIASEYTIILAGGGPPSAHPEYWLEVFSEVGWVLGGFAVAICWATLAVGGRWRAEPSWLDRLGRLIGVAWIAGALAMAYEMRDSF